MKPSLTDVCLWDNLTWPGSPVSFCSALSHCAVFSHSFFAACWRGEAPEQTKSKRLFVPPGIRKHTWTLSFLCLPTSYIHPAWAWVWLQRSTMLHLCAPAHTPEYHNGAPWTSPSNWHPVASVSLLCSLYVASSSAQSTSLSLKIAILFSLHLSIWWPHPAPTLMWLHQLHSRPQSKCVCCVWDTRVRLMWFITSISFLSAMCHPGHFILKIYICEFNMWPVSAERMPTCVVWEIKVFGLLKATIKSQQGRQHTDKQRSSLPLSLHLLSLSHVSHVFFFLIFLTSRTGFVCENKALRYKCRELKSVDSRIWPGRCRIEKRWSKTSLM